MKLSKASINLGSLIAEAVVAYELLIKFEQRYSDYKESPSCDIDFIIQQRMGFQSSEEA